MAETTERIPCPRCDGRGVLPQFFYNRKGICFMCWGRKYITVRIPSGQTKDGVLSKLQKDAADHFKKHPPKVKPIDEKDRRNKPYWDGANSKVDVADPENHLTDAELAEMKRKVDAASKEELIELQKSLRTLEGEKGFEDKPVKEQLRITALRKMVETRMKKEGIPFEKPKGTPKPNPNPNGKKGTKGKPEFETIATVGTYTVDKGQHTQTGEDLYRVKNSKRLSRDDFKKESVEMKKLGGYYSKYVGGYLFKEDPTDKLAAAGVGKKSKADELKDGIDAIANASDKTPDQRIMAIERFHQVEVNAAAREGEIDKKEHMALYNYGQEAIKKVQDSNVSPDYEEIMGYIDGVMASGRNLEERLEDYRDILSEAGDRHEAGKLTDAEYQKVRDVVKPLISEIRLEIRREELKQTEKLQEEKLLPRILEKYDLYNDEDLPSILAEIQKWEDTSFKAEWERKIKEDIAERLAYVVKGELLDRINDALESKTMGLIEKVREIGRIAHDATEQRDVLGDLYYDVTTALEEARNEIREGRKQKKAEAAEWFEKKKQERAEILKPKTEEFTDTKLGKRAAAIHAKGDDKEMSEVILLGEKVRERLDEVRREKLKKFGDKVEKAEKAYMEAREKHGFYSEEARKAKTKYDNTLKAKKSVYEAAYFEVMSEIRAMGDQLDIGGELPGGTARVTNEASANKARKMGKFFPKQWVDASNVTTMGISKVVDKRAAHYGADYMVDGVYAQSHLSINSATADTTMVHEVMHRMEYINPNIHKLEEQFYSTVTKGNDLTWLGSPYKRHEKYRVKNGSDWVDRYMGKDYTRKQPAYDNREFRATFEMMTMGIEGVVYNTYHSVGRDAYTSGELLDSDIGYYSFVLGVLASV